MAYAWPDPFLQSQPEFGDDSYDILHEDTAGAVKPTILVLPARSSLACYTVFGSLLILLLGLLGLSGREGPRAGAQTPPAQYHSLVTQKLGVPGTNFRVSNEYSDRQTTSPAELYPWLKGFQLVEPYRETLLNWHQPVEGHTYEWEISASGNSASTTATGHQIVHVFQGPGEYPIVVTELDEKNETLAAWQGKVICKYVRREIHALTDADREELLDAMLVLWTVPQEEGQLLYGPDYVDMFSLSMLHTTAANDVLCDRIHDGLGFLISHNFITNVMEQVLQLINPRVAMPYWDYTIEAHKVETELGGDWRLLERTTSMFTAKWFGSANKETLMVQDGRWGNYSVPRVPEVYKEAVRPNVYGLMRSPWNTNNRPYLTRGMGNTCGYMDDGSGGAGGRLMWPNCQEHYDLQMNYHSFYSWAWYGMYRPHGPVHLWLGGFNDCNPMYKSIEGLTNTRVATALKGLAFLLRDSMMRGGWWGCQGEAPMDLPRDKLHSEGYCGCTFDLDDHRQVDEFFDNVSHGTMAAIMRWQDRPTKQKVAELLCTRDLSLGEHTQASSVLDPSFWPIHPTMERLWMFKRLTGSGEDLWWPNGTVTREVNNTEYEFSISWQNAQCPGHGPDDVFPYGLPRTFDIKVNVFGKTGINKYTNAEALALLDPRVDAFNYVYDNFEWPHCRDQGFDMDDVWDLGPPAGLTSGEQALLEDGPSPRLMLK